MISSFTGSLSIVLLFLIKCGSLCADTSVKLLNHLTYSETKILSVLNIDSPSETESKVSFFDQRGYDDKGNSYKKYILCTSYAPEDKLYQGGGALAYYLSPIISVKTGPSWCPDLGINKKWKWACQLNFEFPFSR